MAVALSQEVNDIPVPVQALGEELVLFRDLSGGLALLADTVRIEERLWNTEESRNKVSVALPPGWCYDRRGKIIDRPAEPIKTAPNIRHPWYPVQELNGFVFAYMGEDKDSPPPLPRYDVLVMDGYRVAERGDTRLGRVIAAIGCRVQRTPQTRLT